MLYRGRNPYSENERTPTGEEPEAFSFLLDITMLYFVERSMHPHSSELS